MVTKDPFFKSADHSQLKRKRPSRQKSNALVKSGRSKSQTQEPNGVKGKEKHRLDEEIEEGSGDDDGLSIDGEPGDGLESEEEDDESETPAQKRLRLAQAYLEGLKQDQMHEEGNFDAAEIDREIIASRLQQDVLESTGKMYTYLGAQLQKRISSSSSAFISFKTGRNQHRLPVTCVKLNKDGSNLYVADKQGKIVRYDCQRLWKFSSAGTSKSDQAGLIQPTRVMPNYVPPKSSSKDKFNKKQQSKQHKTLHTSTATEQKGHIGEILTIDVTEDEKILASGGKDKLIGVWDLVDETSKGWKVGLRGHKDVISSISFRLGTSTLYTASFDRMIKAFNLESLTYSETLFGHQDKIHSTSSLRNEVLVSAGGRDRTCRYWKIVDESQLVFRGGGNSRVRDLIDGVGFDPDDDLEQPESKKKKRTTVNESNNFMEGSIDCVCMIDDKLFLSGGDSGSISLWTTSKKKAVFTQPLAHGTETITVTGTAEEIITQPRWITALYCLPYTDLFVSGSWDGVVRVWRLMSGERGSDIRKFQRVGELDIGPTGGIVNSLHAAVRTQDSVSSGQNKSHNNDMAGVNTHGKKLAVAIGVGQEHRLGRWKKDTKARNHAIVAMIDF